MTPLLFDMWKKFQLGFRARHSTEVALLRVFNDLVLTVDSGSPVILVLLDLSTAFDTVDHEVLLFCLDLEIGIIGSSYQ